MPTLNTRGALDLRYGNERGTKHRVTKPKMKDIAWAAGIYEGEGCLSVTDGRYIKLAVTQKDPWILHKLLSLFGGTFRAKKSLHLWSCYSNRAIGFALTIYPFLSPRRQLVIRNAIRAAKDARRVKKYERLACDSTPNDR